MVAERVDEQAEATELIRTAYEHMDHLARVRTIETDQFEVADGTQSGVVAVARGYTSVFNIWTPPFFDPFDGRIREKVLPGAYLRTLREGDITADWNHNDGWLLGRTSAGTLRLREDDHGLYTEIDMPDNEWGRPVADAMRRGEVRGMSLSFFPVKRDVKDTRHNYREITVIEAQLRSVGPVIRPAQPLTSVGLRSALRALGMIDDAAVRALLSSLTERQAGEPVPDHSPDLAPTEPVSDHSVVMVNEAPPARRLVIDEHRANRLREMLARAQAEARR